VLQTSSFVSTLSRSYSFGRLALPGLLRTPTASVTTRQRLSTGWPLLDTAQLGTGWHEHSQGQWPASVRARSLAGRAHLPHFLTGLSAPPMVTANSDFFFFGFFTFLTCHGPSGSGPVERLERLERLESFPFWKPGDRNSLVNVFVAKEFASPPPRTFFFFFLGSSGSCSSPDEIFSCRHPRLSPGRRGALLAPAARLRGAHGKARTGVNLPAAAPPAAPRPPSASPSSRWPARAKRAQQSGGTSVWKTILPRHRVGWPRNLPRLLNTPS
jgi:hypothetical protein